MTNVTILFLDQTFSSTAIGPMEVFRHTGTLWNNFTGHKPICHFRVTTASVDGRAVHCDGPIDIQPAVALTGYPQDRPDLYSFDGTRHRRRSRAQCAGSAMVATLAQAWCGHRECLFRCRSGCGYRSARR